MANLARNGPPVPSSEQDDDAIIEAINKAVALLCEPSEKQQQLKDDSEHSSLVANLGRIVCISNCKRYEQWLVHLKCLMCVSPRQKHRTVRQNW